MSASELSPTFGERVPLSQQNPPAMDGEIAIPIAPTFSLEERSSSVVQKIIGSIIGLAVPVNSYFSYEGFHFATTAAGSYGYCAFGVISTIAYGVLAYHSYRSAPDATNLLDPLQFQKVEVTLRGITLKEFAQIQTYYRYNHLFKIETLKARNLIDEPLVIELSNVVQRYNAIKNETIIEQEAINEILERFRRLVNEELIPQLRNNRNNQKNIYAICG